MAIRNDFIIDWSLSPRLITIQKPSTECTMQDLLDTLRYLEAQPEAMDNPVIVQASGKEPLGGGTKVGLTVAMQNAQISFEARTESEGWTVCNLLGGNLVAFDTDGVTTIEAIHPTAFVTISKTSSSSATLQEQDALNYSSYQNAVWINASSSQTGTDFPSGTRETPVNNVQEAVIIANEKGFDTLCFIGNYTLGAGDDVTGFTLIGQNPTRTFLTLGTDAIIANVEIKECTLAGILDGNATVRECVIWDMDYFSGYIHHSVLTNSTITLGNNATALFLHCYSGVAGANTPTIDMGGSGQSLGLRNYNGGIKIINKTGDDGCSLDVNAGQVKIDSTCTAGDIYVRGVFKLTDNSNGTTVHKEGKAHSYGDGMELIIADAVWDKQL